MKTNFIRKRLLSDNLINEQMTRQNKIQRYKSTLTCVICAGDAHGYNFDAISCESCKAFFRRNALRSIEDFKCRDSQHCDVSYNVKKRCKKCRLNKCFEQGMRKEWILSDKEKQEKRIKIEENRRLKQLKQEKVKLTLHQFAIDNESYLIDKHWLHIRLIQTNYAESVKLNQITGITSYPFVQPIESTLDLFRIPLYISSMRLITFLKQINEFQQLDKTNQLYLMKLNLLTICFYHSLHIYDSQTDSYHEHNTSDPIYSGKDWTNTLNKQFHCQMKQIQIELMNCFPIDQHIRNLFMFILLFSQSICQCAYTHIYSLNVFNAQNIYIDLLYRYCLHQYDASKTPILFMKYIFSLMKIQQLVDEIKYHIQDYIDVTQLSPLIQSLIM